MFEKKLETRVNAVKKILKNLMCGSIQICKNFVESAEIWDKNIHKTLEFFSNLFHLLRFNEKKTENLWNRKLSKFSIRGHAYEKLDHIVPLQHLFLDVDLGDKHLHSLTISVRDGNGDLFHFNGFPLEFELKTN